MKGRVSAEMYLTEILAANGGWRPGDGRGEARDGDVCLEYERPCSVSGAVVFVLLGRGALVRRVPAFPVTVHVAAGKRVYSHGSRWQSIVALTHPGGLGRVCREVWQQSAEPSVRWAASWEGPRGTFWDRRRQAARAFYERYLAAVPSRWHLLLMRTIGFLLPDPEAVERSPNAFREELGFRLWLPRDPDIAALLGGENAPRCALWEAADAAYGQRWREADDGPMPFADAGSVRPRGVLQGLRHGRGVQIALAL